MASGCKSYVEERSQHIWVKGGVGEGNAHYALNPPHSCLGSDYEFRLATMPCARKGLQKAEVIGLEYGIECQTTKDINLSLMAFQLFCGCREFYLLIHSPLPRPTRTEESGAGHQDRLSLVVSCAGRWNGVACASPCVRMREPRIPPKPRGHLCDHYHNHIKAAGD